MTEIYKVLVKKVLDILIAARDGKRIDTKHNRAFYNAMVRANPNNIPYSQLSDSKKALFDWHEIDPEMMGNLEIHACTNKRHVFSEYKISDNLMPIKYPFTRDIDSVINAMVDLYNNKPIYIRRNYEHDQNMLKYQYEKLKEVNKESSVEKLIGISKNSSRYDWRERNDKFIKDNNGIISFAAWDFMGSTDFNHEAPSFDELLKRRVGITKLH